MNWVGLPAEVRETLPAHRRAADARPATGAPELWVIGTCGGCGTEWAGKEGAVWPTCSCGGRIFPPRPEGFPNTPPGGIGGSEAVQGPVQGLVAFRMVEGQAVGVINTWTGVLGQSRERKAHEDAHWPIYEKPPLDVDEEGAVARWLMETFRFGPRTRPIRLTEGEVAAFRALSFKVEHVNGAPPYSYEIVTPFGSLAVETSE